MGVRAHFSQVRLWLALVLAILVSGFAVPALAQSGGSFAPGSICHIGADLSQDYDALAASPDRWICDDRPPDWYMDRNIVRIDLRNWQQSEEPPRFITVTPQTFGSLEVISLGTANARASQEFASSEMQLGRTSAEVFLAFPELSVPIEAVVFVLDDANDPEFFIGGEVSSEPPFEANAGSSHLIAALLCGLLLAPVFFDIGFARALRESFPLYHALFCVLAFAQTISLSGVLERLIDMPDYLHDLIVYISFNLMIATVALFALSFIERDRLKRWHRYLLMAAAAAPVASSIVSNFIDFLPWTFYEAFHWFCFSVFLIGTYYVLIVAAVGGSRSARFLMISFAPLLTLGLVIVTGGLVPALAIEFDDYWVQNFSLIFEVVVSAIAVTDRFLSIKRQRDRAVSEARSMEALSERDALTGLLNRRALTVRFEALRAQGFTAMALVDLDHFKSINDTYGHQVGDEVLKAAARAFTQHNDEDLLAFRIGGEEFLLLLRGRAMQSRAEERRLAVSTTVAQETDIDRHVTASMGFLEASSGAVANSAFEALYERVDGLLYDAKETGRNRMVAEKISVFQKRERNRRTDLHAA